MLYRINKQKRTRNETRRLKKTCCWYRVRFQEQSATTNGNAINGLNFKQVTGKNGTVKVIAEKHGETKHFEAEKLMVATGTNPNTKTKSYGTEFISLLIYSTGSHHHWRCTIRTGKPFSSWYGVEKRYAGRNTNCSRASVVEVFFALSSLIAGTKLAPVFKGNPVVRYFVFAVLLVSGFFFGSKRIRKQHGKKPENHWVF